MKDKKAFLCLMFGQAVANIGDTIYTVAIISAVFLGQIQHLLQPLYQSSLQEQ